VNISPLDLNKLLENFYAETSPKPSERRLQSISKDQAMEYHTNTFKSIRLAVNRHLHDVGRDFDIVWDRAFKSSNNVLDGRLEKNLQEGRARPTKHKEVIPPADLQKMSQYLFSDPNPVSLRFRVWVLLSLQFVSRGLEFHEQLRVNSIVFLRDENGMEYATLSHETKQKNWQGVVRNTKGKKNVCYSWCWLHVPRSFIKAVYF
jgi:hypothetical protein